MTAQEATKIKRILRKENAVFTSTAGYYDGKELRVKVADFMVYSSFTGAEIKVPDKQKEKEAREHIIKVLRALERNGLRPEYRLEQRETSNTYGRFDSRYIIFK